MSNYLNLNFNQAYNSNEALQKYQTSKRNRYHKLNIEP